MTEILENILRLLYSKGDRPSPALDFGNTQAILTDQSSPQQAQELSCRDRVIQSERISVLTGSSRWK